MDLRGRYFDFLCCAQLRPCAKLLTDAQKIAMSSMGRVDAYLISLLIVICSFIDLVLSQTYCTRVQRFGQATGVVEAVWRISNSIGYSGIYGVLPDILINTTNDPCRIKLAAMHNKAGTTVQASIDSAQSTVRSNINALLFQSVCPGFGMCADLMDAEGHDVWPITALTVGLVAKAAA